MPGILIIVLTQLAIFPIISFWTNTTVSFGIKTFFSRSIWYPWVTLAKSLKFIEILYYYYYYYYYYYHYYCIDKHLWHAKLFKKCHNQTQCQLSPKDNCFCFHHFLKAHAKEIGNCFHSSFNFSQTGKKWKKLCFSLLFLLENPSTEKKKKEKNKRTRFLRSTKCTSTSARRRYNTYGSSISRCIFSFFFQGLFHPKERHQQRKAYSKNVKFVFLMKVH